SSALSCLSVIPCLAVPLAPPPFPTRRSSDLAARFPASRWSWGRCQSRQFSFTKRWVVLPSGAPRCHTHESAGPRGRALRRSSTRSEEHTSELQSRFDLVCRLLLEKKQKHFVP